LPSVSFSGIDKASSRRGTYEAPVCNVVLDVHVKQYDMCMWSSTTCACGTVRHVHVGHNCAPGKETFLSEKNKVQHRTIYGAQMKQTGRMTTDLLFVGNQRERKSDMSSSVLSVSSVCHRKHKAIFSL